MKVVKASTVVEVNITVLCLFQNVIRIGFWELIVCQQKNLASWVYGDLFDNLFASREVHGVHHEVILYIHRRDTISCPVVICILCRRGDGCNARVCTKAEIVTKAVLKRMKKDEHKPVLEMLSE